MNKKYLYMAVAALAAAGMTGCDDDFARPPMVFPSGVDVTPTATLQGVKTAYWGNVEGQPTTIGLWETDGTEFGVSHVQGDSVIFTGRVCSSDETGNIYKNIIIQHVDEQGEQWALTFAVNNNKLYQTFKFGQEVAVYASGLTVGGYRGLMQFGSEGDNGMSFMDSELFSTHVKPLTGLPSPAKVDTTLTTITELTAAKADVKQLMKWQSRLIRIDNVSFTEPGQPFAGSANTNRYIADVDGNRMIVRNSAYASFKNELLPSGTGSVAGILSYFGSDWQILLIDAAGCIGFEGGGDTPENPEGTPEGEGTAESPFNTVKALEVAKALAADVNSESEYYVKGIVSSIKEISPQFGNGTYSITSEGTNVAFDIYRSTYLNGEKFTSEDQLKVGDEVVVCGKFVNYKGNTPQMAQGGKIISINGQTGGDTPVQPGEETTIFSSLSENDQELPAGWTLENIEIGTLDYVWSWKVYKEKGYLNASAFKDNTAVPSEAYAISPVVDLAGATGCSMTFDHAAKFQTTLRQLCGVCVREEGATEWTVLTIPTWPEPGAWTFASSGAIDLSAYDGKKVQVAFKYKSSTEGADTWEIKNLTLTGKK